MAKLKYTKEQVDLALADLLETGYVATVSERHLMPKHVIYRFRRK